MSIAWKIIENVGFYDICSFAMLRQIYLMSALAWSIQTFPTHACDVVFSRLEANKMSSKRSKNENSFKGPLTIFLKIQLVTLCVSTSRSLFL